MTTTEWHEGDRVQVSFPYGDDGVSAHLGTIDRIQIPGPHHVNPHRTHKVRFDDPLIMGGMGIGWFIPEVLTREGDEPAEPERYSPQA